MEDKEKIKKALDVISSYGQVGGSHHKMWVIDQVVRVLLQDEYEDWVKKYMHYGANGVEAEEGYHYAWDKGIAP